jgi:hypothetical protein
VDIQTWLRSAICNAAIEAVYLPDAEIPPHVPGLDVASLPEQLMRAVVR